MAARQIRPPTRSIDQMDVQTLSLSRRQIIGKKVKTLRRKGIVPVHMYGSGTEALSLQTEALELQQLLPRVGTNVPLSISVEDGSGENICFVREVQRHPVTEEILHVDFLRVDVSQTIQAEVPVNVTGESPAVRDLNGTLLLQLQSILVEALPMNVPASLDVDISGLDNFEKAVYVSDVAVGARVTFITGADEMIARVSAPRIEVEAYEEEEEEGELEEGAVDEEAAEETSA
jgi:large subunit ribosomal protein L25